MSLHFGSSLVGINLVENFYTPFLVKEIKSEKLKVLHLLSI